MDVRTKREREKKTIMAIRHVIENKKEKYGG